LKADMPKVPTELSADLSSDVHLEGKTAIFFKFSSETKEKSLCTLWDFYFK